MSYKVIYEFCVRLLFCTNKEMCDNCHSIASDSNLCYHNIILKLQMPTETYRSRIIRAYLIHMILRDQTTPPDDLEEAVQWLELDMKSINAIRSTHYLHACTPVIKAGNLHIAWDCIQSPDDHYHFVSMLRVSPTVFQTLVHLIENHPIFPMSLRNQLIYNLQQLYIIWGDMEMEHVSRILHTWQEM